jgi:hypothetical protein
VAEGIKTVILEMFTANEARLGSRWLFGLPVMLFSLIVWAENASRIEISPAHDSDLVTDEIYNSASEWRKPPEYESEWRPEKRQQETRIRFGYDSAYEEMRARGNDYTLDTGMGLANRPQNTQFKLGF